MMLDSTGARINNLQRSYHQPLEIKDFLDRPRKDFHRLDPKTLNIFLANQQIYLEASPVFYSRDTFDFGLPEGIKYDHCVEVALDFLSDRPEHVLSDLKKVRLAIGRCCTDKHFHESPDLNALCDKLGKECQLDELEIGIIGIHLSCQLPQACMDQLCKIKGLRNLNIWIKGRNECGSRLQELIAFIQSLRSQVLIGGENMGVDGIDVVPYLPSQAMKCRISTWKPEGIEDEF